MDVSARHGAQLESKRTWSLSRRWARTRGFSRPFPASLPTLVVQILSYTGCLSSSHSPAFCLLIYGERQAAPRLHPSSLGGLSFIAGCVDLVPTSLQPRRQGFEGCDSRAASVQADEETADGGGGGGGELLSSPAVPGCFLAIP